MPQPTRPLVSLLTDFGARDPSAAICKGVILSIAPDAQIVDISHEVRKYAVRDGALLLWSALPYLPIGVHVAVVDPGVGTQRRPIAIRTGRGDVLVGPDNGLLLPATERLGRIDAVRVLANPAYRLPIVSTSFHGRDIFAPAAGHLATGTALENLGPALDYADLVKLELPEPTVREGALETAVIYVDTFGNVKLAGTVAALASALGPVQPGDRLLVELGPTSESPGSTERVTWQETFGRASIGRALLYEDSYGRLCLADNQGNIAGRLKIVDDQPVVVRRAT